MLICVSLNEFLRITIGWIYCLAPYHKPRFIDEITDEIITRFKTNAKTIGKDFFYYEIELRSLYKFIEDLLMPIPKFRDLNLSQIEYEMGLSVDDDDRDRFVFTSAFDTIPEDEDFIDLDACIQNIFSSFEHQAFIGDLDINELNKFREKYEEKQNDMGRSD